MTPNMACPECGHVMTPLDGLWLCSEGSTTATITEGGQMVPGPERGCGYSEPLAPDIAAYMDPNQGRLEGLLE